MRTNDIAFSIALGVAAIFDLIFACIALIKTRRLNRKAKGNEAGEAAEMSDVPCTRTADCPAFEDHLGSVCDLCKGSGWLPLDLPQDHDQIEESDHTLLLLFPSQEIICSCTPSQV